MMKKQIAFLFASLFFLCSCTARRAVYNSPTYGFRVDYSDTVQPGDPVYIAVTYDFADDFSTAPFATHMKLIRNATGKSPGETDLYIVRQNPPVVFGQIPLSSWLDPGEFTLKVTYTEEDGREMQYSLPVTVTPKEFVTEVLELDNRNTAIKTDSSPARTMQINRLNDILFTTDNAAVYYDGTFAFPVTSTRRTSFFADRRTYKYTGGGSSTSLHYGIDFGVPTGTPVTACGNGKVVLAEWRNSTGWSVVIEHLPGFYSLYYHMDKLEVKEGEMIRKGEEIGLSGATGLATGPHLHWEVRLLGEAVDPDFFVEHKLF